MQNATFTEADAVQLLATLHEAGALIARLAAADMSGTPLHDALRHRSALANADLASLQIELAQLLSQTSDPDSPHVIVQISAEKTPPVLSIGPTVFCDRASAEETITAFASSRRAAPTLAFPMPETFVACLARSTPP